MILIWGGSAQPSQSAVRKQTKQTPHTRLVTSVGPRDEFKGVVVVVAEWDQVKRAARHHPTKTFVHVGMCPDDADTPGNILLIGLSVSEAVKALTVVLTDETVVARPGNLFAKQVVEKLGKQAVFVSGIADLSSLGSVFGLCCGPFDSAVKQRNLGGASYTDSLQYCGDVDLRYPTDEAYPLEVLVADAVAVLSLYPNPDQAKAFVKTSMMGSSGRFRMTEAGRRTHALLHLIGPTGAIEKRLGNGIELPSGWTAMREYVRDACPIEAHMEGVLVHPHGPHTKVDQDVRDVYDVPFRVQDVDRFEGSCDGVRLIKPEGMSKLFALTCNDEDLGCVSSSASP